MTPAPTATALAIARLVRPLRLLWALGWAGIAIGVGLGALGALTWSARLGWLDQPWWVLLAWASAVLAVAVSGWLARRSRRGLSGAAVARRLEGAGGGGAWREGGLTMLLEPPAAGTSPELLWAADRAAAESVEARGAVALAAERRSARGRAARGGTALLAGLTVLAAAGPADAPGAALWHPVRAWEATVAPVRLRADRGAVEQGGSVTLSLEAPGRRNAVLWLRAPGEPWRPSALALDSAGRATREVGPLVADLYARATSGRRASDTVSVRVRLPVFVGALSVIARYPAYLGLEDEPLPLGADTLLLPAGTRIATTGEATADLASAGWVSGERRDRASLTVEGARFRGTFLPAGTGSYRLDLATRSGAAIAGDPAELVIRIAPDQPPAVDVPVPGADTLAPLGLRVPLVIDVRDDYGITAVTVESRRVSRLGLADSALSETVAMPPGAPDRAILPHELDLTARGLLPGDTLRYSVLAIDNAPVGQVGRSREFVLRLPTLSEVRAAAREASQGVAGRLDSLVSESRQAERLAEDLSRERARAEGRAGQEPGKMSFEDAKRAQGAAESQEALAKRVEEVQRALEALQESMQAAGIDDPEWQRRLQEIQDQLERALTGDLREKLADLQRALQELDPERTREALEKLAEAQRALREALERSRELFRRAALEGDLANLEAEARDLARQQEQWTSQAETAEARRAAAEEEALAARADSLSALLDRVAAELARQEEDRGLAQAAREAEAAAEQMRQAGESARRSERQEAQRQGRAALDRLQPLGDRLERERESMQEEWRQEVLDAIDRALVETSRLGRRQLAVSESFRQNGGTTEGRAEQASVEEGVQKLLEQMKSVSGKNALVSPQIALALTSARLQMRQARDAVATASPNPREAAERSGDAVDALNAAAYLMLRSRNEVSGSASGSGLSEALEQLSKLAGQQGSLNQQTGGLLPLAGRAGLQEQLRRLGAEQRALAEELERLRAQGHQGAGELSEEAKELARQLEAGRLDRQTVERQERLFRRMLDAGRTLQGQEEDDRKERQSTAASGDSVRLPTALRRTLQDGNRIRVPTWEELQRFSPEERRLVVDYFRRLTEAPR